MDVCLFAQGVSSEFAWILESPYTMHPSKMSLLKTAFSWFLKSVKIANNQVFREGVNREKLTVKKLIDNEMFFFSPFMSLTNREKSA